MPPCFRHLGARRRPPGGRWAPSLLVAGVVVASAAVPVAAAPAAVRSEEVSFRNGDVVLGGTLLIPAGAGPWPALVMVHGAGPGPRERQRREAEAFATAGIATLIYDKRTEGYSQTERSYALLADDALAAVRLLRARPEVDPLAVGLWGLSEGGWVVPLAAARSDEVAFAVTVAASGVSPARQTSWQLETMLRHQGVAGSLLETLPRTWMRLLVDAGLFAEADQDPLPPWRQVRQPVLALWGALDRITPPAESGFLVREALERGGNRRFTLRFLPDANHGLRASRDGFDRGTADDPLAAGYVETVAAWVALVARGNAPGPYADPPPPQTIASRALPPFPWFASAPSQLAVVLLLVGAFAAHPVVALGRLLRRRGATRRPSSPSATSWAARAVVVAGLATVLGWFGYLFAALFTQAHGVVPVIAGRPWGWLLLQALALVTVLAALVLGIGWWRRRGTVTGGERWRLGLLVAASTLFVPWATFWGLLVP